MSGHEGKTVGTVMRIALAMHAKTADGRNEAEKLAVEFISEQKDVELVLAFAEILNSTGAQAHGGGHVGSRAWRRQMEGVAHSLDLEGLGDVES